MASRPDNNKGSKGIPFRPKYDDDETKQLSQHHISNCNDTSLQLQENNAKQRLQPPTQPRQKVPAGFKTKQEMLKSMDMKSKKLGYNINSENSNEVNDEKRSKFPAGFKTMQDMRKRLDLKSQGATCLAIDTNKDTISTCIDKRVVRSTIQAKQPSKIDSNDTVKDVNITIAPSSVCTTDLAAVNSLTGNNSAFSYSAQENLAIQISSDSINDNLDTVKSGKEENNEARCVKTSNLSPTETNSISQDYNTSFVRDIKKEEISDSYKQYTKPNSPISTRNNCDTEGCVKDENKRLTCRSKNGMDSTNAQMKGTLVQTHFKIIVMNTNGPDDRNGNVPNRRRQAIQQVILKHKPELVLFQEFGWVGIRGKTWVGSPIPDQYRYIGHLHASMAIEDDLVDVQDIKSGIDTILRELQRTSNNRLGCPFPMDFAPISRMCIGKVSSNMVKSESGDFICISWHGRNKGLTDEKKRQDLMYLLELMRKIKDEYKIPLVVGGDFNISFKIATTTVQSPFILCPYTPSSRRKDKVIDFYIISEELKVKGDMTFIDLDNEIGVNDMNSIFDHDPLVASFMFKA